MTAQLRAPTAQPRVCAAASCISHLSREADTPWRRAQRGPGGDVAQVGVRGAGVTGGITHHDASETSVSA